MSIPEDQWYVMIWVLVGSGLAGLTLQVMVHSVLEADLFAPMFSPITSLTEITIQTKSSCIRVILHYASTLHIFHSEHNQPIWLTLPRKEEYEELQAEERRTLPPS